MSEQPVSDLVFSDDQEPDDQSHARDANGPADEEAFEVDDQEATGEPPVEVES